MTAPPAWRAISPVSRVTWCLPYWKVLVIFATFDSLVMRYRLNRMRPLPHADGRVGPAGVFRCRVLLKLFRRCVFPPRKCKPRRIAAPRSVLGLATQAEFLDQGLVALAILLLQIVEQAAAAVHELEQATAAVVVFLVGLEVAAELFDAGGDQGDLDFRRTGVGGTALVVFNDFLGIDGHSFFSEMRGLRERGFPG